MSKNSFTNWTPQMVAAQNAKAIKGRTRTRPGRAEDQPPLPPLQTAAAMIGAPTLPRRLPSNWRNDGRAFENALEAIFTRYQSHGLMRVKKCEPPCKVTGFGAFRRVIFLENDYLDFVGSWNERGARFTTLEAKSTSKPVLPLNQKGGLTTKQVDALRHWTRAGCVAAVLWEHRGEVKLVRSELVEATLYRRKSLRWEDAGNPIKPGVGLERWQILSALRLAFK
jgi:penicillin-binding protein-related factor A (putative recombinase)